MDTQPTIDTINDITKDLESCIENLRWSAKKLKETGDFEYAAEALSKIRDCFGSLRIDLLITRPLREYDRVKLTIEKS